MWGLAKKVPLQNTDRLNSITMHIFSSNYKDTSKKCHTCSVYLTLPCSSLTVSTGRCIPLIPPCALTVACSSVQLQQGDCRNMTSPQLLLQQELWLILHDQSSWLPVMQFCTVNLYSSSILMLFLVPSPCDRQPSYLFHIFQIIWDYFLKLLFHHGK